MHGSWKIRRFTLCLSLPALFLGCLGLSACGDSTGDMPVVPRVLEIVSGNGQTGFTDEPLPEAPTIWVRDPQGVPVPGMPVTFSESAGGGRPSALSAVTDGMGQASVQWTLGPVPVRNGISAEAVNQVVEFTAWAEPGAPPALQQVFQAPGGFNSEGIAFDPDRGVFLGTDGGLLRSPDPQSPPEPLPLSGEQILSPLGLAFGPNGDLFVCDSRPGGGDVKRVSPAGICSILSPGFEGRPFALPNSLAMGPDGFLYLTSTCDNRIYRISPESGATEPFASITGPNGIAFDPAGSFLYITTENPGVFCDGPWVPGGLYRMPLLPDGTAGEAEPLVENFAVAGDGLAFDRDGNLYVVFSGITALDPSDLLSSVIYVYTPEDRFIPWIRVTVPLDIFTNVAFGTPPFDPYSIYAYGFTGRLHSAFTGIPGRPIP